MQAPLVGKSEDRRGSGGGAGTEQAKMGCGCRVLLAPG